MPNTEIIDIKATESLFGDISIAIHLYRILYGMLKTDHDLLLADCRNKKYASAKSLIHRIKGALKYCKTPSYEKTLIILEQDVESHDIKEENLIALEQKRIDLYNALKELLQHQD